MVIHCSRCGKTIKDMFVRIESSITVSTVTPDGRIENCNNMKDSTAELLCEDCFNKYCDCLNQLNNSYDNSALNTIVEVVDDIQYGTRISASIEDLAGMVEIVDDEDITYDSENYN